MPFTAPDGAKFASKAEFRDYMFAHFLSVRKREGEEVVKRAGDIGGQPFEVEDVTDCTILLLDHCDQVQVDNAQRTRLFIGPCSDSVFLRDCANCDITVACKQFRVRDCTNCRVWLYAKTDPVIEASTHMAFAPFNGAYAELENHFSEAGLDPARSAWHQVHDFHKGDEAVPEPHWYLMPPSMAAKTWRVPAEGDAAGSNPVAATAPDAGTCGAEVPESEATLGAEGPATGVEDVSVAVKDEQEAQQAQEDQQEGGAASQHVSLIDGTPPHSISAGVDAAIRAWGMHRCGREYGCVAIMGCQSSGKSTLLNGLFGTSFQTMEAAAGRSQTTKGVWLSRSRTAPVLVMDLEGTDSKERGEDRGSFERQSALFALALGEVLMINMWQNDVGRYSAANYDLLKAVFEVNLQLMAAQRSDGDSAVDWANVPRTTLLFVIRDHTPQQTPLSKIEEMLRRDVEDMWREVPKLEPFQDTSPSDFFDFAFVGMPHLVFCPEQFDQSVAALRARFEESSRPDYLLPASGDRRVPADGFAAYAQSVWQAITQHRDLNLPSQRRMLASFRCDQIARELLDETSGECAAAKDAAHAAVSGAASSSSSEEEEEEEEDVDGRMRALIAGTAHFASLADAWLSSLLAAFDDRTKLYHAPTVAEERVNAAATAAAALREPTATLLGSIKTLALATFDRKAPLTHSTEDGAPVDGLEASLNAAHSAAETALQQGLEAFQEGSSALCHAFGDEWTTLAAEAKQEVATELARRRSIQCRRQSDLVKRAIPRRLRSAIAPAFDRCLKSGAVDMWPRLHAAVQACGEEEGDPNGVIAGWLKSTGRTPTQVSAELAALPKTAADAVRAEIRAAVESGNAKHAMIEQFRRAFEVDSAGLPRVEWESTEALKRAYTQARDRALAFARLLASSRFHGVKAAAVQKEKEEEEEDDDKDSVEAAVLPYEGPRMDVLGEEEREDLEQSVTAATDAVYRRELAQLREAERQREMARQAAASATAGVPRWAWILMLVLGWNEIWSVLTNPVYLLLLVLVGAPLYFFLQLPQEVQDMTLRTARARVEEALGGSATATAPAPATAAAARTQPARSVGRRKPKAE